jgi:hypothetical protein
LKRQLVFFETSAGGNPFRTKGYPFSIEGASDSRHTRTRPHLGGCTMSWTTNQVTQNGNTTGTWTITGGSLTNHDAIVVRPEAGGSGLRLNSVTARIGPNRYSVSVTVVGGAAMAFRFAAEAMD